MSYYAYKRKRNTPTAYQELNRFYTDIKLQLDQQSEMMVTHIGSDDVMNRADVSPALHNIYDKINADKKRYMDRLEEIHNKHYKITRNPKNPDDQHRAFCIAGEYMELADEIECGFSDILSLLEVEDESEKND